MKNIQDDEERTMAEVWKLQKPQRTSSQKFSRNCNKQIFTLHEFSNRCCGIYIWKLLQDSI
ncbi:hypothetical protein ACSBR1_020193 [Camellia fascicularis]